MKLQSPDAVLLKASDTLHRLHDICSKDLQNCEKSSCLSLYTQAILDITFYEENQLVDEEFPGDDSLQKVRELIQMLLEPEHLVEESKFLKQHIVLDVDVQECLRWRRGALLYMYCHTVGEREGWVLRDQRTFHQCLEDGVHNLMKMLHTRNPVQLNDEVSFQDINTAALLAKGIFSDIHVLALMYCGEMCFWALTYCMEVVQTSDAGPNSETCNKILNFKEVGEHVLETYVDACEGPLRGQGWNTDNAKKILQSLRKDRM
ncbi:RAB7A-interacting MON1-CCZ1 complex subunit 1 isoform X2 [Pseudophryne corroboree]|uniref:RAB7A-interacting MON1-CCZ1 complex subunit 1 isoform X2 n=1 Tax=Pseudophryne corroboree TaxID=495146 RepID=UPI003081B1BF